MLYRTTDGHLLVKQHGQTYLDTEDGSIYYIDENGNPYHNNEIILGKIVTKMWYDSPDEYLKDFPGESVWWSEKGPNVKVWLMQSWYVYNIKGSFLLAYLQNPQYAWGTKSTKTSWVVVINDGDDFYMKKYFDTQQQAETAIEELKTIAPFQMDDLVDFGYNWD